MMSTAMKDWKRALKADPTDRLLADDDPVVRYWALRDLSGASRRSAAAARRRVAESEVAQDVFRQQKPEGHWERPDNMHHPHYTSTVYQLTLLGDLGLTADDERVARGVRAVLRTQRPDGGFPGHNPRRCPYGAYDVGLIVRFMHQVGLGEDRRLARMYKWIEVNQAADGGWVGVERERRPDAHGCLNATANVLWGLAAAGGFAGTEVAGKGIRFLAEAAAPGRCRQRPLSYPQFWNFWVDDIKLAEIYLGLGGRGDEEPLAGCVRRIVARQRRDGWWNEGLGPYPEGQRNCRRMRELFPRRRRPSKWVTAKAMMVLRGALAG
jgi:hypothetical protein